MALRYRRDTVLEELAMYFLERGEIIENPREYSQTEGVPYRLSHLKKFFNSYTRIIRLIKLNYPEVVKEIALQQEPATPVAKPDIQAQFAAAKAAAAMELDNGKDI